MLRQAFNTWKPCDRSSSEELRWELSMLPEQIAWERLRAIFGNPNPVANVTERQFDYEDEKLQELGRTAFQDINFDDLWYYHHDLAYVELQQELFEYLFPVCLMDWHRSLLAGEACSHGDSEFHYGIHHGQVLHKMLTEEQRRDVFAVFRDSFLYRLDQQRGLPLRITDENSFGWLWRFNSLGKVLPDISPIWLPWWKMETPGRAVAAMIYCAALVYESGEANPVFELPPVALQQGFLLPLWDDDSYIRHQGWPNQNVEFIRQQLTIDFVFEAVERALGALEGEAECSVVLKLQADMPARRDVIESRVAELPDLLSNPGAMGWSA
jgi:hypothetical protein